MKTKQSKVTRRITMALSSIMLAEQLAGTGAVLYAHAEDEVKTEYSIAQNVTASWDGGCNANIILTNLADRDTQDWSITFCTTDKITNLWGGTITECLEFKTAEEEAEIEELEEADDKFEDIFESAFKDEFEDDIFADFSDEFEEEVEEEYIETSDEENEVENTVEVSENATENVTSEEVDVVEPTVVETETEDEADEATEETEEVIVETQEYDFNAPAVEEYEVYYQYTVKALDYNAVIKAGESVTIGYMAEGNNHDIWDEKAEITLKEAEKAASIPVGGTYKYDNYTVEVKIPAYWDGAYNVQLLITNTGDETIHNWAFVMETDDTISGLYNAVEVSGNDNEEANVHLIKNAGFNQDIPVGGTIEVGYTAYYEDEVDVPNDFALSQIETEVTTAECEVSLLISNEWENGGLAQIIIKNISELPIEDWMIEFDSALDIKEIWGGVIESHEGEHYFIRNSGYAQNILPGESWTVGILFSGDAADIENVQVRQIVIGNNSAEGIFSVSKDHMTINEDGNYELNEDFTAFSGELARVNEVTKFTMQVYDKNDIKIYETDIVPAAQWTLEDYAFIYGLNRFEFEVNFGTERYTEKLIVNCKGNYNFDKLTLDTNDNDGDGLVNYLEKYFGTDENDVDTDDDELTDYQELVTLGYNPIDSDTDADGIPDKDEDADEDGISNKEEYDLGSNPAFVDSDNDGLLDSIELGYGTSLAMEDTDNDGISDYEEYTLDQLGAIHNSDGTYTASFSADTMECAYDKAVIPELTLTGSASAITNFSINMIEGSILLNPSMIGYMGQAYEFTTDGNLFGAELTFTYDETYINPDIINSPDFYPAIYYFNPVNKSLEEVANQTWNGNKVTAHLDHFSTYLLADKNTIDTFWNTPLESIVSDDSMLEVVYDDDPELNWGDDDKATVNIKVYDMDRNPIPNVDVYVYNTVQFTFPDGSYGVTADVSSLELITKTDNDGNAVCNLDIDKKFYKIYLDKNNAYGGYTVVSLFRPGDAGTTKNITFTLYPYTEPLVSRVEFIVTTDEGPSIDQTVDEYNLRIYKGWGLDELEDKNKVFDGICPEMDFSTSAFDVNIPKGAYTAEFEKEGYPKKRVEFLVTGYSDTMPLYIKLDGNNNLLSTKNNDKNNDGLDDELTKLICQGEIRTKSGDTVWSGYAGKEDSTWEEVYEEIMSRSDYDYDFLSNGEEISICYDEDGHRYIEMISSPEIKDSDWDGLFDNEEINIYSTDPLVPDSYILSEDYTFISNYGNFESGKAYGAYLDRSGFTIGLEYVFNGAILGGDISMNTTARMELLDLFIKYAQQNTTSIEKKGVLYAADYTCRFVFDCLSYCNAAERMKVINDLHECEVTMGLYRAAKILKNYEVYDIHSISGLKNQIGKLGRHIKELENSGAKLDNTLKKYSRYSNVATIAFMIAEATVETVDDVMKYSEGIVIVEQFESILAELSECGDLYISNAAKVVYNDINSGSTTWTNIKNGAVHVTSATGTTVINYALLKEACKENLIIDLIWLVTDLAIGETLQNSITNFVSVSCANAVTMVSNKHSAREIWIDSDNDVFLHFVEEQDMKGLIHFECFARKWAEEKYSGYLDTKRNFGALGGVWFIYDTPESKQNAENNIVKLNDMIERYGIQ